jgi:hypothetical protein
MKKILNEWRKFLNEAVEKMSEEEIEKHRISIAERIFDALQKPSRRRARFPQELPFLYYLYKGVEPVKNEQGELVGYKISNENNVDAVLEEIKKRVQIFIYSLDPPEDKIFAADALMMAYYMHKNKQPEAEGLTTAYGVGSPGDFDTFIFGKSRRSFFQPFKKDLDFMLKKSPELANIPEEHRGLFDMQTIVGEILKTLKRDPSIGVPPLTEDQFKANYLEGLRLKDWEALQKRIVKDPSPDEQVGEAILDTLKRFKKILTDIQQGNVEKEDAIESMKNIKTALTSETFDIPAVTNHPLYKEVIGLAGLVGAWEV